MTINETAKTKCARMINEVNTIPKVSRKTNLEVPFLSEKTENKHLFAIALVISAIIEYI